MRIISFVLAFIFFLQANSQTNDRLLWYQGKKLNDSMLITTDASIVTYSKPRSVVIVKTPVAKDQSAAILKRLNDINNDKKELVEKTFTVKNSFFLYPHITAAFKEFDEQNAEMKKALSNVIQLPKSIETANVNHRSSGGVSHNTYIFGIPAAVKQAFNEVMQNMKNYPPIDFPPPPAPELGACFECDGKAQNQEYINRSKWFNEFSKYEYSIINRSLQIIKTIDALGLNKDPEAAEVHQGLDKAIDFAFARLKNKLDLLIRNYGSDFTRLKSVVNVALSLQRQQQLLGKEKEGEYARMITTLLGLFDGFEKYLQQQVADRNYDVLMNAAFMIGMERQRQLLGGKEKDLGQMLDLFSKFNRFRIEIEGDFSFSCNYEENDCSFLSFDGKIKSKKDLYVSLAPYKCGSYQIYMTNTAYRPEVDDMNVQLSYISSPVPMDRFQVGLTSSSTVLKTIRVKDDGETEVVTKNLNNFDLLMNVPVARISFCNDKEDTLYVTEFYNKGDATDEGRSELKRILNLIFTGRTEDELAGEVQKLVGNAEQYEKRKKEFNVEPTGFEKLDKMQNASNIMGMFQENAAYAVRVSSPQAVLLFDAENRQEEIVNAKLDVSGKTLEDGTKIKKGIVKIKLVHDPIK